MLLQRKVIVIMYVPAGPGPSAAAATAAVLDGLGQLARLPAADLSVAGQADCLRALERAEAMLVAARSSVLQAFGASGGYAGDGQHSPKSWLTWQARVTRGAAGGAVGWARRLAAHPAVARALAAGAISASWARRVCELSDRLPASQRDAADEILVGAAAAAEVTLADLHALAEEMFRRCAPPDGDGRGDPGARGVYLDTHFQGAGKLAGDLTPRCTEALRAVLESLGKRHGADDLRTRPERLHDALEEACRRLIGAAGLPDRAGQHTQIQLHMTLSELMRLRGGGAGGPAPDGPAPEGTGADDAAPGRQLPPDGLAGGRAGYRGTADDTVGLSGLSGLVGAAAGAGDLCDATVMPVVTGRVDPVLLDQLAARDSGPPGPGRAARDLVLAEAVRLLSGPGGLAAVLRAGLPVPLAATASLPLDLGRPTDTIPPHLRRAVIGRDRTCRFPGCEQPPAACDVHHLKWRSSGGVTRLPNLILMCRYHHLRVIHEQGWRIQLHPDATVTAISPDGSRVFRSHSPPGTSTAA